MKTPSPLISKINSNKRARGLVFSLCNYYSMLERLYRFYKIIALYNFEKTRFLRHNLLKIANFFSPHPNEEIKWIINFCQWQVGYIKQYICPFKKNTLYLVPVTPIGLTLMDVIILAKERGK